MLGLSELAVILIVVIAFLAAKKLPELARAAGKSARILKAEARELKKDKEREQAAAQAAAQAAPRVVEGQVVARRDETGRESG